MHWLSTHTTHLFPNFFLLLDISIELISLLNFLSLMLVNFDVCRPLNPASLSKPCRPLDLKFLRAWCKDIREVYVTTLNNNSPSIPPFIPLSKSSVFSSQSVWTKSRLVLFVMAYSTAYLQTTIPVYNFAYPDGLMIFNLATRGWWLYHWNSHLQYQKWYYKDTFTFHHLLFWSWRNIPTVLCISLTKQA